MIYDDGFNWLTKMCLSTMQDAAFEMIRFGREAGCQVFVCSSDASDHRLRYLEHCADAIILGEGEITLGEVIEAIASDPEANLEKIPGLALLNGDEIVLSPPRKTLREPDTLPRPAWDLVELAPYEEMWRTHHGYWSLNLVSSRGCPYSCTWCAKPIYGDQYFLHSPERVVEDLAWLKKHHDFEHVWFCDDIFGLRAEWLEDFADGLEQQRLDIRFMIQARVDLLARPEIVNPLARAGLDTVWMGVESGAQKIMDAMAKGITVEQVREATGLLKSAGVRVAFFLQFGYLGEDQQDIQKTVDLVLDLSPDEIGISVSYPLPGPPFYDTVQAQLGAKTNWTDSGDLALMYQGTFSPEYYRRLHRYVHRRFQTARGLESLRVLLKAPWRLDRSLIRTAAATAYHGPAALVEGLRLKRLERA
ncbi:MAG: radical SAM protein [Acidobacteria bacterium]|nr:MAG: radical SAM protein [Acidobacteriota bacterium]